MTRAKDTNGTRVVESILTVADHIELMQMGRITAIGLYPDRTVVMHVPTGSPDGPQNLNKLTLLLTVKGLPSGQHDVDSTIIFPSGKGQMSSNNVQINIDRPEEPLNLLMSFTPFQVLAPGEFKLRVTIPGFVAEQSFRIVQRDLTGELMTLANPRQLAPSTPMRLSQPKPTVRKKVVAKSPSNTSAELKKSRKSSS